MDKSNFKLKSLKSFRPDKRKGDCFPLKKSPNKTYIGIGFIGNFKDTEVQKLPNSPNNSGIIESSENGVELGTEEGVKFNPSDREELILLYAPLIEFVANRIARRLPSHFEINDLISAGVLGLIDAIEKYDPTREAQFKTYAELRIRGAMFDELRSMDWMPRSVRENSNQIKKAVNKLEQKLGRRAHDEEVAEVLGIEMDKFHNMALRAAALSMLSLDKVTDHPGDGEEGRTILDNLSGLEEDEPQAKHAIEELKQILAEAIDAIPEQERLVISLYYYEEMNMKEIGQVMEVTESRVSQIHSKAIARVKGQLELCLADY